MGLTWDNVKKRWRGAGGSIAIFGAGSGTDVGAGASVAVPIGGRTLSIGDIAHVADGEIVFDFDGT